MTLQEAKALGDVIQWADSGCVCCVESLASELTEVFPQFVWALIESDDPQFDRAAYHRGEKSAAQIVVTECAD